MHYRIPGLHRGNETIIQRMRRQAAELRREADNLRGSTWFGDPPWLSYEQRADDLEIAARALEQLEHAKTRK